MARALSLGENMDKKPTMSSKYLITGVLGIVGAPPPLPPLAFRARILAPAVRGRDGRTLPPPPPPATGDSPLALLLLLLLLLPPPPWSPSR